MGKMLFGLQGIFSAAILGLAKKKMEAMLRALVTSISKLNIHGLCRVNATLPWNMSTHKENCLSLTEPWWLIGLQMWWCVFHGGQEHEFMYLCMDVCEHTVGMWQKNLGKQYINFQSTPYETIMPFVQCTVYKCLYVSQV